MKDVPRPQGTEETEWEEENKNHLVERQSFMTTFHVKLSDFSNSYYRGVMLS
jgi:hypothetical protein